MKSNKSIGIFSILIIVGFMGFKLFSNKTTINENASATPAVVEYIPVKVATVVNKKQNNTMQFSGNFVARKVVPLNAEAQGSLIELNIEEGQKVTQGQIIARIDPTAIQSNLNSAKVLLAKSIKDKERYERLVKAGAISQKQYEDISLNVDNAKSQLASIEQQLRYTIIHSPMSGFVSEVKVERGSFATVGMKIGTIIDISKLKMQIKVSETDVVKIKYGQQVEIHTEVYPDQTFIGNISLISVQADEGRKFDVEIEVPNHTAQPIKAGMFGTVVLEAQHKENEEKLFIPRNAIIGSIKDPKVFLVKSDNTVVLTSIKVQNVSGDELIVTQGLLAGEKIVSTGQINLQTGNKITIIK